MSIEENKDVISENDSSIISKPDYESEILNIIRSNDSPKTILNKLADYHGNDIAQVILSLNSAEIKKFLRVSSPDMLADIFEHLEPEEVSEYINMLDIRKAAKVISELETDTAANVLHNIEKEKRALIIEAINPEIQKEIRLIASFDEEEIGSRMTTNCIIIRENLTIKQAMSELVKQAEDNDNISTLFVVDENDVFYGAVDLKDLIIARNTVPLESLIVTSFPYVYANETIDDCIEELKDYSESVIPVLDSMNKLLGVITSQSIIEVVDDEMGEDYARLAGLTAEEDLNEPLLQSMKKRLPWLLILLCLGMLVSSVISMFDNVIAQLTIIIAFQSLILDMAGNVGTQSLAVTIRVLMDENLTFKQKGQLVIKEMRVGLCNGLLLGIISYIFVGLYLIFAKHQTVLLSFAVSGCICVSLVLAMLISSAVGTLIPLFFKKIKVDPAVASGPLITTINDLVAVVTYYGISWILLLNVLHLS
ncbi:MAG: magnesium transporter [Lachnospiraceae bacterium]|nr:magnesium transporter [Lachnospiraceae bacterium]